MTHGHRTSSRSVLAKLAVALLAVSAARCGMWRQEARAARQERQWRARGPRRSAGESGLADAGKPVRGGKLIYGLEAETGGGYCLAEGQLAISGIMVARAFYDTLTVPNDKGEYVPYLAKSVTHDADYKTWTITLRDGIKFHDGTPLTAEVVKNNIDAYRGKYPGRIVAAVLVRAQQHRLGRRRTGDARPSWSRRRSRGWPSPPTSTAPAGSGIMAQAQLDDKKTCDRKLIGTGPFKFESWQVEPVAQGPPPTPTTGRRRPTASRTPTSTRSSSGRSPRSAQRVNALAERRRST